MTATKPKSAQSRLSGRQFVVLLIFLTIAGIVVSHWLMLHYQLCGPSEPKPCLTDAAQLAGCPTAAVDYPCHPELWTIGTLVLPLSSAAFLIYLAIKSKLKA